LEHGLRRLDFGYGGIELNEKKRTRNKKEIIGQKKCEAE
jgi:hypothetical protein